jgi:monofunctional biosynthetic peptidoglycan transglycosylase
MLNQLDIKLFNRLLLIIQALFWILLSIFLYNRTHHFINTIKSINHLENNYFDIKVDSSGVYYNQVTTTPKNWVNLKNISKNAISAIVVSEDGKFFFHPGYDIEQIQKVVTLKFQYHKKKVRGASTITQQLIKNLYLTKEKSLSRKMKEFYYATFIEEKVSKDKILEVYLNVIEYGKGIYGIENASQFYFKKSAKYLSPKEGAFLAMLLPSPVKYAKSFHQKSLTPFASRIINSILLKMRQSGQLSEEQYLTNLETPLTFEKKSDNLQLQDSTSEEDLELEDSLNE